MKNNLIKLYGLFSIGFLSLALFSCRVKAGLDINAIIYPINQDIQGESSIENSQFQLLYKSGKRVFSFKNPNIGSFKYKTLGIELFDDIKIYADSGVYFVPITELNGKEIFVKGVFGIKGKNIEINGIKIDGLNKADIGIFVAPLSENCRISNCEIKNLTTESGNSAFGVFIANNTKNITITDNYIHHIRDIYKVSQPVRAIQVGKARNITIERNVIDNLSSKERSADVDGIHVQAGSDVYFSGASGVIRNNIFNNTRKRAIKLHTNDFEVSSNIIRSANETEYCVYSAISVFGANCKVIDNDIELKRGLVGISLSGSNGKSSYNTISNNRIFIDTLFKFDRLSNWGSQSDTVQIGIDIIAGAHDNIIKDNTIFCPTIGIKLGESHQNLVSNNTMLKTRFPLWIQNSTNIKLDANLYINGQNNIPTEFKETIINSKNIETTKNKQAHSRQEQARLKSYEWHNEVIKEENILSKNYNQTLKNSANHKPIKVYFPEANQIFNSMSEFKEYFSKKQTSYIQNKVYYIINTNHL